MKKWGTLLLSLCMMMSLMLGSMGTAAAESQAVSTTDMPDANLRYYLTVLLHHDESAQLTYEDLASIEHLYLSEKIEEVARIENYHGLALCQNLQELVVYGVQPDCSEIAALPALRSLIINGTPLTDWSALAAIETLEMLDLTGNEIADLSPADTLHSAMLVVVSDNRVDMSKPENIAYTQKLEEAASSYLHLQIERLLQEQGMSEALGQLNWNVTSMAKELAALVNISQFPKEGGLYEDAFPIYLREIRLDRLLSELTNGKLEIPDASIPGLLTFRIDGAEMPAGVNIVDAPGAHSLSVELNAEALCAFVEDLLVYLIEEPAIRDILVENIVDSTIDLDAMTNEELFALLYDVGENGYIYTDQLVPVGDASGRALKMTDILDDEGCLHLGGSIIPVEEAYQSEFFVPAPEGMTAEEIFLELFVVDEEGYAYHWGRLPLRDEEGRPLEIADLMDENGNLLDENGQLVNIRDMAEEEYGPIYPMDEEGYLLDDAGNRLTDKEGKPIHVLQANWETSREAFVSKLQQETATTIAFSIARFGEIGDLNGDGKLDTTDARLALQYAVGKIELTGSQISAGDVNADGKVDTTDARLILQKAVGKIDQFPAGK